MSSPVGRRSRSTSTARRRRAMRPCSGRTGTRPSLWTDFGLKFIDEARKANKPFFLYLAHNAPHFPLMAPPELIAKHRGQVQSRLGSAAEARYRRQIKMGLVEAAWPLSPREAESPAWESLSDGGKDRFDHLMAVYAAMVEAIDTSVGVLVRGSGGARRPREHADPVLSDNGANAESGPEGRFNGSPPGGPSSNLYLGMNWAALGSTPFRRFKHFTHEGGIAAPLVVHWPRGIPANRRSALERQPAHVIDVMPTLIDVTGASYPREFKGQTIQPMEGVSLRPTFEGGRSVARGRSSGSTRATAPSARATGSSCRHIPITGSCTTWWPTASSATTSRRGVQIS